MLWMLIGFGLSCYAVIGNDSIQTIGTFLSSNRKKPWFFIWLYLGTILTVVLVYGWVQFGGDVSYGRLSKIPLNEGVQWWHIIPILALLFLTRIGVPVSTTFMALSIFTGSVVLEKIITKSLVGYAVAFGATFLIWCLLSYFEKKIFKEGANNALHPIWGVLQWLSTGFLWTQWLMQDLANIYVFAPRQVPLPMLIGSLVLLLTLLAFLVREKGGKIQNIITSKVNTLDIRSATCIDFFYGLILYFFKNVNNIPMSTTWVFLGCLAGRELILTLKIKHKKKRLMFTDITSDLGKASIGLIISVVVAVGARYCFS